MLFFSRWGIARRLYVLSFVLMAALAVVANAAWVRRTSVNALSLQAGTDDLSGLERLTEFELTLTERADGPQGQCAPARGIQLGLGADDLRFQLGAGVVKLKSGKALLGGRLQVFEQALVARVVGDHQLEVGVRVHCLAFLSSGSWWRWSVSG